VSERSKVIHSCNVEISNLAAVDVISRLFLTAIS
jgi:hypothetical protein